MTITLSVGKEIPSKPKNVFVLHVRSMSGDAGAYNENVETFALIEIPSLEDKIRICVAACSLNWNASCDKRNVDNSIRSLKLATLQPDEAVEWFIDMVGYDVTTCSSDWARLDRFWITFNDDKCSEFEVEISLSDEYGSSKTTYGFGPGKKL